MSPEIIPALRELQTLNFVGLMSIPAAIIGVAWRLSSRLTKMETTLSAFVEANNRDHKRIISAVEKHGDTLVNHGERIASLEGS